MVDLSSPAMTPPSGRKPKSHAVRRRLHLAEGVGAPGSVFRRGRAIRDARFLRRRRHAGGHQDRSRPHGCTRRPQDLRWTFHERRDPRRQAAPLLFTELACAYSHVACWQWALDSDLDAMVVFEDDAEIIRPLQEADVSGIFDLKYLSNRMPADTEGAACGYGCGTEGYARRLRTRAAADPFSTRHITRVDEVTAASLRA